MPDRTVAESDSKQTPTAIWPRFSLRSLLLAMVVASVLFAPVPMFGTAYLVSMLFSVGVLLLTWSVAVRSGYVTAMCLSIPIGALIFLAIIVSISLIPLFFHAVGNVIACLFCAIIFPRPKIGFAILATAMLLPYAVFINQGINDLRAYDQMRLEHPFESLENRIAVLGNFPVEKKPRVELAPAVEESLKEQAQATRPYYSSRVNALERLHDATSRRFVAAQGFGVSRMPRGFRPSLFELDSAASKDLPLSVGLDTVASPGQLHSDIVGRFIDPDRTGYVRSLQEVAGFGSHAITGVDERNNNKPFTAWEITKLQLVSLLRHKESVAYETESLPQMEEIEEYPHRPLNEFETSALPKLRTQQDVVIEKGKGVITMLGAIRADKNCLACHSGQRGDLLGAFSYVLRLSRFDQ